MTIIEIAKEIGRNPKTRRSFRRKSDPTRVIKWSDVLASAHLFRFHQQGDFWSPYPSELAATDWEFFEP